MPTITSGFYTLGFFVYSCVDYYILNWKIIFIVLFSIPAAINAIALLIIGDIVVKKGNVKN